MSSLIAIIHDDGSPVEPEALGRAIGGSRRGPDSAGVWTYGPVGLAHGLLDVSGNASEHQPSTLDGAVWIAADARIDGRDALIRELTSTHRIKLPSPARLREVADDALLLYAYATWGRSCVDKLIGDFAFAIWDDRERRLFCARDQLGVAPLFYTWGGGRLIVASELDCIRAFPGVDSRLDDLAVADFLMFGQSQDPGATIFAAVRRLPAAHTLSQSQSRGGLDVRRYWELKSPGVTEPSSDPTEELEALIQAAVDDRLRDTDSAGISLSGGIDSPLIAAMACGRHSGSRRRVEVRAETVVFDSSIPDDERRYAGIAAEALEIPIKYRSGDGYGLFEGRDRSRLLPEPSPNPVAAITEEMMRSFAEHTRVALTGYDGDALCQTWLPSHFRRLIGSGRLLRVARELRQLSRITGNSPPKGITGLQAKRMLRQARRRAAAEFPPWIDADLVRNLDLIARWQRIQAPARRWSRAPEADAIELLTGPGVRDLLDRYDPVITGASIDVRHPLFDLRVIDYALGLPPIPWKIEKTILRRLAGRSLPASLSGRPKTPLVADPIEAQVLGVESADQGPSPSRTNGYVNATSVPSLHLAAAAGTLWPRLWVTELDLWLTRHGIES